MPHEFWQAFGFGVGAAGYATTVSGILGIPSIIFRRKSRPASTDIPTEMAEQLRETPYRPPAVGVMRLPAPDDVVDM